MKTLRGGETTLMQCQHDLTITTQSCMHAYENLTKYP